MKRFNPIRRSLPPPPAELTACSAGVSSRECGIVPSGETAPALAPESLHGIQVSLNTEKQGVEIRFPSIPTEAIRARLKTAGWRWSRFSGCWYIRHSPENLEFARSFIAPVPDPIDPIQQIPVAPDVEPTSETVPIGIPPERLSYGQEPAIDLPEWKRRLFRRAA